MGYGYGGTGEAGCGYYNPFSPAFILFLVLILLFFGDGFYGCSK
ncbi:hypothetical protein [Desulfotomaculum nigrificans]|nr:hypothetical protein [Desulfotomaculum nigrificans]